MIDSKKKCIKHSEGTPAFVNNLSAKLQSRLLSEGLFPYKFRLFRGNFQHSIDNNISTIIMLIDTHVHTYFKANVLVAKIFSFV